MDKRHNPVSAHAVIVIYNVCKNVLIWIFWPFLSSPYPASPNFHPASRLCLETFHPESARYYTHTKLGHSSNSVAVVPQQTYPCMFLNISVCPINISQPHSSINRAGVNSSLKARGHVGRWVEFHPASLSEGWDLDVHTNRRWFHGSISHWVLSRWNKFYRQKFEAEIKLIYIGVQNFSTFNWYDIKIQVSKFRNASTTPQLIIIS